MTNFIRLLCTIFCCSPALLQGQTMMSGDIFDHVSTIISGMPGSSSNQYAEPTAQQLTDWNAILVKLFAANYAGAHADAAALSYDLVQFTDNTTGETYYALEKLSGGTNYWGTYILNPTACRDELVLMAPHPKFDFNTGKQAIYCFQKNDARFFMLSGTHRCNQTTESTCSGTTTACGSDDPYRISDMAHVTNAIWQRTTEYLEDNIAGSVFVQLHGFTMLSTDPYVIMSNGTRLTPVPDYIVTVKDELFAIDPVLTFKIAHIDLTWTRLIGFDNTNGRRINDSANPCTTSATATNGRFLHIEQEKTRLRDDVTGWHKMAMALSETFDQATCGSLAALPIELGRFEARLEAGSVQLSWTTFSESGNDFFEVQKSADGLAFENIGRVEGQGESAGAFDYEFKDVQPMPGWNYYRLLQTDFDGAISFSPVATIFNPTPLAPLGEVFFHDGIFEIHLAKPGNSRLQIFDGLGRLLLEKSQSGQAFSLSLPMLQGIFFYQLAQEGRGEQTGKFLVVR